MSDYDPQVSIILPTYKRPHCLGRAVRSVIAQSHPNWELLVSDNGGDGYRFDDPRIIVVDSKEVVSAAYARNQALPRATGDLVGFLDDDDEMEPHCLERLVDVFRTRPEAQMVKCQMMRRGLLNDTFGTPTVLMRRSYATASWQPVFRQDRSYYASIIERHGLSTDAGTLVVIPDALCRSGVDPKGGLRAGNL
jgi:glycosyltransferase involved in cell wall biosynthesis